MNAFVVSVWTPETDDVPVGIRGQARHLASGATRTFADGEQLIAFLLLASTASQGSPPELDGAEASE